MRPPRHRIPAHVFAELASGGGGPEAVRRLVASRLSRSLLLVRAVRDLTVETGHPAAGRVAHAYRTLARVQARAPEAVAAVLLYPTVGAWAASTVAALGRAGSGPAAQPTTDRTTGGDGDDDGMTPARPEHLALVAAAAAVRGRVPVTLELPSPPGSRLVLPGLGVAALAWPTRSGSRSAALVPGGDRGVLLLDTGRVEIPQDPHASRGGWHGLPRVAVCLDGLALDVVLDRARPLGGEAPEPDPSASRRRAPADWERHQAPADWEQHQAPADWEQHLTRGWEVLVRHHRVVAQQVAALIKVLSPMPLPRAGITSGTFRDLFGWVAVSPPPDPRWLALTLAHEVQHTKLTAVMDLVPLLTPGPDVRLYAPWRDDRRPLAGLLHGLYAHVGVAGFWRVQRRHERSADDAWLAEVEFARWRSAAREVADTLLDTDRLTPIGRELVEMLAGVLDGWLRERVPAAAEARAAELTARHRLRSSTADG